MNKISFNSISLDCYMQKVSEISNEECHEGVISKDKNGRLRFEENTNQFRTWTRNPHIFEGKFINMARRKNGAIKFNFKNVNTASPKFNASDYAFHVYSELTNALKILN